MILPKSLRLKSSRSFNISAPAIKIITILNVVTAETILKFPTTFISTTQESAWKKRKIPVIVISLFEYLFLLLDTKTAIPKNKHWLHHESIVPAVNPVVF